MTRFRSAESPGGSRYFFVGLGALCMLIAIMGFGPSLYKNLRGELFFPPIVHVHGAIMMGWVLLYTVQAALVARGLLHRHRQIGWAATTLATAVWISMGVVTIMTLQRYDPDRFGFIVKPLLIGIGTMVVFPVLVTWAVLARRQAGWHKRLMTLATFTLVQAALDVVMHGIVSFYWAHEGWNRVARGFWMWLR